MEPTVKSFLLIGGPYDGRRTSPDKVKVTQGQTLCLPVFARLSVLDFKTIEDLPTRVTPPEVAYYQPEILRGQKVDMMFYRYIEMSLDEALLRLFERYQGDATEAQRIQCYAA